MSSEQQSELKKVVTNGVRLAGDTLVAPGTSLLLDGQIGQGVARIAIGVAARVVVGPIGWLLVAVDSYAKTTTGSGLLDRALARTSNSEAKDDEEEAAEAASS
ncbi:MAG: hypothetical protein KC636_06670 [Myxococcales bacterium]|nr:hypothetical protein [Myxococcales bacterium]